MGLKSSVMPFAFMAWQIETGLWWRCILFGKSGLGVQPRGFIATVIEGILK